MLRFSSAVGVRRRMQILGIIVLALGIGLSLWVYYVFANLAIAAWIPGRANKKWVEILEQPVVQYFHPIIKWIIPLCLLLVAVNLALKVTLYFVK